MLVEAWYHIDIADLLLPINSRAADHIAGMYLHLMSCRLNFRLTEQQFASSHCNYPTQIKHTCYVAVAHNIGCRACRLLMLSAWTTPAPLLHTSICYGIIIVINQTQASVMASSFPSISALQLMLSLVSCSAVIVYDCSATDVE